MMTDSNELVHRIAAVLSDHQIRLDYNHPAWGKCQCGFNPEEDEVKGWWERQSYHQAEQLAAIISGRPNIDKMAEAIWQCLGLPPLPWEKLESWRQESFRIAARAANGKMWSIDD